MLPQCKYLKGIRGASEWRGAHFIEIDDVFFFFAM
jgi:hypothetical protein